MTEISGPPPSYRFWQVAVVLIMSILIGKMALDLSRLQKEVAGLRGTVQPILDLSRDVRADISKSTFCLTHDKLFEIHRVDGKTSKIYGAPGVLVRESDTDLCRYALREGTVQIGMDYGMIIARVVWRDRLYLFGAPPGWAITREEFLTQ